MKHVELAQNDFRKVGKMFKEEKGSMIIEGAIVLPIVLVVVLVLITLSIVVHDVYVSKLLLAVIDERNHQVNVEEEIKKRVIGKTLIKKNDVLEEVISVNRVGKEELVKRNFIYFDIPFIGEQRYEQSELIFKKDLLKKIMIVEMTGDIFDDLTISKAGKDKYKVLLKSVLEGLEKD